LEGGATLEQIMGITEFRIKYWDIEDIIEAYVKRVSGSSVIAAEWEVKREFESLN
jgi:hypothetical protein